MSHIRTPVYQNAAELDGATVAVFLQFGLALADTKHRLGKRMSEWVIGAPTLEAAVAAAAITQDELGHARSLLTMLRDFPGAPPELSTESDQDRQVFFHPRFLDIPWKSWLEVIAMFALLDQALTAILEAARESAFVPFRQRVAKILQEEYFHSVFCQKWLMHLADASGATRKRLQETFAQMRPIAVQWLGPENDPSARQLVEAGILSTTPAAQSALWRVNLEHGLQKLEVDMNLPQLDWQCWTATRREIAVDKT